MNTLPQVTPDMRQATYWTEFPALPAAGWTRQEAAGQIRGGVGSLLQDAGQAEMPTPPPASPPAGFQANGRRWSEAAWEIVRRRADVRLRNPTPAFAVDRLSLRTWPTARPAFRRAGDREFDQWQETRIHRMEPVRILGESADGAWYWVESRICAGWTEARGVATATDEQWDRYHRLEDPVVVVGNDVTTEVQPYDAAVSRQPAEFGAYLPAASDDQVGHQSVAGHVAVLYPVRERDGSLKLRPALIKDDGRIHRGYLPYRRDQVVGAAFTQLGDRYDWGDRLGNHDCSSLVMDAYRTVGVQIPRNSGVQARNLPARVVWGEADSYEKRLRDLEGAAAGDLLYMPGHVMMYLGQRAGVAYAIHAFVGYGEETGEGFVEVPVNAVEVSSLAALTRQGMPFLAQCTRVCRLL
jgi:hypothetical protein